MCGRYIFGQEPRRLYKRYHIETRLNEKQLDLKARYNIAPGSLVPVVTRSSPNTLVVMKWGLVPNWSKDIKIGSRLINARAETIDQKPSFKSSFKNKRCLVPATGFYEWQKNDGGKVPFLVQLRSMEIFSFAGIWDAWKDAEGKEFKTFSIITTEANGTVRPIHHRMPVIIDESDEITWMNISSGASELRSLLKPYPDDKLEAYAVSSKVNSPQNQGKELIQKV